MNHHKLYIIVITLIFIGLTIVFIFFPRSKYSELEKRELATFPQFSTEKLKDNSFTKELSAWFSDSEPFRDKFMAASMTVRDKMRMSIGDDDEAVSFHAGENSSTQQPELSENATQQEIEEYQNKINANENAKMANHGIIIVGKGKNVRALMAFGGSASGGKAFAEIANTYKQQLAGVNVYVMILPLASEFYTPDKAKSATNPQLPTIKHIHSLLKGVTPVNAYGALAQHVEEDIYLRTDHHWAPLGAFYAAKEFAKTAKVPFKDLNAYDRKVVKNFVGTMYGYSKDISIKNAPEDFVYYVPKNSDYKTTYRIYDVNKEFKVTGEGKEQAGPFFYKFKDGSSGAYSTFMGSDHKLTKVLTPTHNGRKLLIIKDSYGNALPGYMFYSFQEVHVVDFRYFTRNIKKYIRDNGITDVLLAMNIFNAYSPTISSRLNKYLTQGDNSFAPATTTSAPVSINKSDNANKVEGKKRNLENQSEISDPTPHPQKSTNATSEPINNGNVKSEEE